MLFHHGLRVPKVCGRIKGLRWQGHLPHTHDYYYQALKKSSVFDTLLVLFVLNLQDHSKKLLVYLVSQKFPDCTETFEAGLIMNHNHRHLRKPERGKPTSTKLV